MSAIAKRLGLRVHDIEMGAFDYSVRVIIGEYEKAVEYVAHIQEIKDVEVYKSDFLVGPEPRGETFRSNDYLPMIWLPHYPVTPREIGTLGHEAIHAMVAFFRWLNMPMNYDTEEVLCHMQAHIVRETLIKFKPNKAKK